MTPPVWQDYHYEAVLIRVIDGDTAVLDCDLGFGFHFIPPAGFRFVGYNAPERNAEEGTQATNYLMALIAGRRLYVETIKPATSTREQQSFARWLARVFLWNQEEDRMQDVAGLMIERGYGNRALRLDDLR